jgi:cyanate permease
MMPVFAVVPPLVGIIYDQSNSYVTMLQPFIVGFVLCFLLVLALPKNRHTRVL